MTPRRRARVGFEFPRSLLLVEVARRCRECGTTARLGLTKAEACLYQGFECERCESWNEDELAEPDVPDWWEELRITGLDSVRPAPRSESDDGGETEVVGRLSDEWRRGPRSVADGPGGDGPGGEET